MPSPSIVLNAVRNSQKALPQVDFAKMKTRTSRNLQNLEQNLQQVSTSRNKQASTNFDETIVKNENFNSLNNESCSGKDLDRLRISKDESPPKLKFKQVQVHKNRFRSCQSNSKSLGSEKYSDSEFKANFKAGDVQNVVLKKSLINHNGDRLNVKKL